MAEQTEMEVRFNAAISELGNQITGLSQRCAGLVADLTACQSKLRAAEDKLQENQNGISKD